MEPSTLILSESQFDILLIAVRVVRDSPHFFSMCRYGRIKMYKTKACYVYQI